MLIRENILSFEEDIREEFKIILHDELSNIDRKKLHRGSRKDISVRVQAAVSRRIDVLFDTQLNYLMADACASIKNESLSIQNDFYALDLRKRMHEESNSFIPSELNSSWKGNGRKLLPTISAVIAAIGGVLVNRKVENLPLKGVIFLVTTIASVASYKFIKHAMIGPFHRSLSRDLTEYVHTIEQQVVLYFEKVEKNFRTAFDEFMKSAHDISEKNNA